MNKVAPDWRSKYEDDNTRLIRSSMKKATKRVIRRVRKTKKQQSRNERVTHLKREKFGIRIPRSAKEALQFDRDNGNTYWQDAIKKEMANLDRLEAFLYHPATKCFNAEDGWQKAPLRMIFDIKNEDRRYKARLVVGGHRVDSSNYNTYSSQVDTLSVLLLFLVCQH